MSLTRVEINKADPKCWMCARIVGVDPVVYGPNICSECVVEYRKKRFVFNRLGQAEMEEMFLDKRGMTCM